MEVTQGSLQREVLGKMCGIFHHPGTETWPPEFQTASGVIYGKEVPRSFDVGDCGFIVCIFPGSRAHNLLKVGHAGPPCSNFQEGVFGSCVGMKEATISNEQNPYNSILLRLTIWTLSIWHIWPMGQGQPIATPAGMERSSSSRFSDSSWQETI